MGILNRLFGGNEENQYSQDYTGGYRVGEDLHVQAKELDSREHARLQVQAMNDHHNHSDGFCSGVYDGMKDNEPQEIVKKHWWER